MGCRAIGLAALSAIFALTAWATVSAQNLDAGKTPQQIFSNTCTACHSTPRGLLKSVGQGQLGGFLRQHYTTGSEMAGMLAGYLIQNGAAQRVETPPAKAPKGAKKTTPETAPAVTQDGTAPVAKSKAKQPPAVAEGAPDATPAKKQVKSTKKGDKRGKQDAAEPAQPAAPVEAKPAEPAPATTTEAPAPVDAKPAAEGERTPPANADGLPDIPEPPPLSPDLVAPPSPATLPPPQPPS